MGNITPKFLYEYMNTIFFLRATPQNGKPFVYKEVYTIYIIAGDCAGRARSRRVICRTDLNKIGEIWPRALEVD